IIGAIATGLLMAPEFGGVGYAEGVTMAQQVKTQATAVGVTIVWTGIISYILFKVIDAVIGLRVTDEQEREGLDTAEHGERAYHM
ncbi:MAG: ammonia channel protein, partial [Methylophilaceae bacterium]